MRDGIYCFMHKSHGNKGNKDWSVTLRNLPQTWVELCVECLLVAGNIAHSFLCPSLAPTQSTFYPVASFVSAVNLHTDCPPSLLKALAISHPDQEVWLQSYYEEKHVIQSLATYKKTLLANTGRFIRKALLKPYPLCVY
jgi:hypothetical protein